MCFDMLIDTTGSHMSFLPEIREPIPLVNVNQFLKFLKNASFYLTARNPPIGQLGLVSGSLDYLLEFGELELPLDLVIWIWCFLIFTPSS